MKPIDKILFDILTGNMSRGRKCTEWVFLLALPAVVCTDEATLQRVAWHSYVFTVLVKSTVVGWAGGPGLALAV